MRVVAIHVRVFVIVRRNVWDVETIHKCACADHPSHVMELCGVALDVLRPEDKVIDDLRLGEEGQDFMKSPEGRHSGDPMDIPLGVEERVGAASVQENENLLPGGSVDSSGWFASSASPRCDFQSSR